MIPASSLLLCASMFLVFRNRKLLVCSLCDSSIMKESMGVILMVSVWNMISYDL